MGIVGDFPQERRVFRIGRGDGRDSVAAAMLQLLFRGGESSAADDFAGDLFAQARFARQFVRSRGENVPCAAEHSEQMHGALHPDTRSHLKGDILDCHSRKSRLTCRKSKYFWEITQS